MSCWVVPTVAAEYWGVSLDVVWQRIYEGLIPHKSDGGFVFVDVDPWTPDATGALRHEPPATFVMPQEPALPEPVPSTPAWTAPAVMAVERKRDAIGTFGIRQDLRQERDRNEDARDEDDELPPLDEDESATFSRLSWHDVRQRVSRTRRPPPALRD